MYSPFRGPGGLISPLHPSFFIIGSGLVLTYMYFITSKIIGESEAGDTCFALLLYIQINTLVIAGNIVSAHIKYIAYREFYIGLFIRKRMTHPGINTILRFT